MHLIEHKLDQNKDLFKELHHNMNEKELGIQQRQVELDDYYR